ATCRPGQARGITRLTRPRRRRGEKGDANVIRKTLKSDKVSRPSGVFSHGVSVANARLIFVSGMLGRDAAGRIVGPGDISAQTHQTLRNIQAVLETDGATLADVIKVVV